MTRNQQISETILLRSLESALKSSLPEGWLLVKESTSVRASNRPDLLLGITGPDGEAGQVLVEAKRTLEPRDIPRALEQLTGYMGQLPRNGATVALMVVAPHLSPRARCLPRRTPAGSTWPGTFGFNSTGPPCSSTGKGLAAVRIDPAMSEVFGRSAAPERRVSSAHSSIGPGQCAFGSSLRSPGSVWRRAPESSTYSRETP